MAISKVQAMRPALNDVIDLVNELVDFEPYITNAVDEWLDEHPEATTTVENGSITYVKLAASLVDWLMSEYAKHPLYDSSALMFTAGAALGITGNVTESEKWLQRISTSNGPTKITSIHGNSIVHDDELLSVNMTGIKTESADGDPIQTRTIDVATYFPDGMRSGGSVYDELTETQAITRIGTVDLGTLTWSYANNRLSTDSLMPAIKKPTSASQLPDILPENYDVVGYGATLADHPNAITVLNSGRLIMYAASADAPTPTGMLNYALATPTTVEINPSLNLTYRTEVDGVERIIIPTGYQSATPTIVTAQGYTAESLLGTIAPIEGNTASANYAVNNYLINDGKLCLVVSSIAIGEPIVIGQNVTATTVMEELVRLTQ